MSNWAHPELLADTAWVTDHLDDRTLRRQLETNEGFFIFAYRPAG